jgi:hypothetical protein
VLELILVISLRNVQDVIGSRASLLIFQDGLVPRSILTVLLLIFQDELIPEPILTVSLLIFQDGLIPEPILTVFLLIFQDGLIPEPIQTVSLLIIQDGIGARAHPDCIPINFSRMALVPGPILTVSPLIFQDGIGARAHPDCIPIDIPANDAFYAQFNKRCLNMVRNLVRTLSNFFKEKNSSEYLHKKFKFFSFPLFSLV